MAYKYNYNTQQQTNTSNPSTKTSYTARVLDVVLDSTHPDYKTHGESQSIGMIRYAIVGSEYSTKDTAKLPIAYPLRGNQKYIPMKSEIVIIHLGPSDEVSESDRAEKVYYSDVINLWNHPHHGGSQESNSEDSIELGEYFQEVSDINPMQPFEGDYILEGRNGQSLRFSTAVEEKTPWLGKDQSKPITILSNGQRLTDEGFSLITEDVNEDYSSIYLTSTQQVPLTPSHTFSKTYKQDAPLSHADFNAPQLLLNSDRIVLNSRKDSILLTSQDSVGVKGARINIEGVSKIHLEAPRIYLGEEATQQVVLGNELKDLLSEILDELGSVGQKLLKATNGGGPIVSAIDAGQSLITSSTRLKTKLSRILSQKSYVE